MPNIIFDGTAAALNEQHRRFAPAFHKDLLEGLEWEGNTSTSSATRPTNIRALAANIPVEQTYTRGKVSLGSVLQPYQLAFTPKMDMTLGEQSNTLERGKVDLLLTADDLDKFRNRWTIEWSDWTNQDPIQWSFPRYLYEQFVTPQIVADLNAAAWAGVRVAATPGVAGAPLEAFNGYDYRIKTAITAGKIVPIAVGALTDVNIVQKVELFYSLLPKLVRNMSGRLIMSESNATRYYYNHRERFGAGNGIGGNENKELKVDGRRARVVGVSGMEGSDRFIFQPDVTPSLIYGTRVGQAQPVPTIRWEAFDRTVKGLMEIERFYDFEHYYFAYVSDNV